MKKKILITILLIILVAVMIFAGNLIRKVIIVEKIKDGLSNRTEYYHTKLWTDDHRISETKDWAQEEWNYPNGLEIRIQDDHTLFLLLDTNQYTIDTNQKAYFKTQSESNTTLTSIIEPNYFIPNFELSDSSFEIAFFSKISTKTMDGKECYEITNKKDGDKVTGYIDKANFDLVRLDGMKFEWEKLTDEPTVEKILEGYKEIKTDNLEELREFLNKNRSIDESEESKE